MSIRDEHIKVVVHFVLIVMAGLTSGFSLHVSIQMLDQQGTGCNNLPLCSLSIMSYPDEEIKTKSLLTALIDKVLLHL